jgi:hypothetical protein
MWLLKDLSDQVIWYGNGTTPTTGKTSLPRWWRRPKNKSNAWLPDWMAALSCSGRYQQDDRSRDGGSHRAIYWFGTQQGVKFSENLASNGPNAVENPMHSPLAKIIERSIFRIPARRSARQHFYLLKSQP